MMVVKARRSRCRSDDWFFCHHRFFGDDWLLRHHGFFSDNWSLCHLGFVSDNRLFRHHGSLGSVLGSDNSWIGSDGTTIAAIASFTTFATTDLHPRRIVFAFAIFSPIGAIWLTIHASAEITCFPAIFVHKRWIFGALSGMSPSIASVTLFVFAHVIFIADFAGLLAAFQHIHWVFLTFSLSRPFGTSAVSFDAILVIAADPATFATVFPHPTRVGHALPICSPPGTILLLVLAFGLLVSADET